MKLVDVILNPTEIEPGSNWICRPDLFKEIQALDEKSPGNGIVYPIAVEKRDDTWVILDGRNRLAAAKVLGYKKMRCVQVIPEDGDAMLFPEYELVLALNQHQRNPLSEARAIQSLRLKEADVLVGKKYGLTKAQMDKAVKLLNLPADLQRQLEAGNLRLTAARALVNSKLTQDEMQCLWDKLVADCKEGKYPKVKDVKEAIREKEVAKTPFVPVPLPEFKEDEFKKLEVKLREISQRFSGDEKVCLLEAARVLAGRTVPASQGAT